jgi:type IV pilus assembly protein PilW
MRKEKGFTLTELLVAMTIAGVVMAAIYSAYMSQQRAYEVTENVTAVQQNIRSAMYFMEREIRMAGYDPMASNLFGFTNVTTNPQSTLSFTWDEDRDGYLSGATETISYQYDSGENTLERRENVSSGFWDIAEYITGVSFFFLDQNGNATTTVSSIKSVQVQLSAERGGHSRTLDCRVLCRNLDL